MAIIVINPYQYAAPIGPSADPYSDYVSLLLHGNGTNGSTTFTDSSGHGHTVTANGDAEISTTESKFGGSSMYFDGSGDYLEITDGLNQFDLGGIDATLEFWAYIPSSSGGDVIVAKGGNTANWVLTDGFIYQVQYDNTNSQFRFNFNNGGGAGGVTRLFGGSQPINSWYHIAVVTTSSNNISLYVNGISVATATNAISKPTTRTRFRVGTDLSNTDFNGYIDDFRITKGVARYTSNFTPPTAELPDPSDPDFDSVSLLLHGDGNNGSTTFIDSSSNSHTVTPVGDAQISTAQSKFGGASMYFDGTGDYLTLTNDASFVFGTGDFTVEMWVYHTSEDSQKLYYDGRPSSTTGAYVALYKTPENKLALFVDAANRIVGTTSILQNAWYHIAVCRQGSSTKLFLNGTQEGSTFTDTTNYLNGASRPIIGADGFNPSANTQMQGYIDDLRVTKGVARYTSNFTPPTAPLPDETPPIVTDGLVLHLDAGDSTSYPGSGNTWTDLSGNGNNETLSGGPTYSSTDGGYLNFDGSNDYGYSPSFTADGRNYTLEVWFKTSTASGKCFIAANNIVTGESISNYDRMIYIGTDGKLRFGHYDGNQEVATDTVTTNDNNWHHAVGTWDGTSLKFYRDNNLVSTNSAANASTDSGTRYWIIAGRRNKAWPSADSSDLHYTPVDISIVRIYWGKSLTSSEIARNYNAIRRRYGL